MGSIDAEASIGKESANVCSICFEFVDKYFDRSSAKLKCGHEFHLDCVGSAFNAKGVMQCPNCRDVEKGKWLFANGSLSLPDINIDEWNYDEYDNSGMVFGFHWCPYGRLAPLIEDGESFLGIPYPDFIGSYLAYLYPQPYVFTQEQWNHILLSERQILRDMGHGYSLPGTHSSRLHPFFGHGYAFSTPNQLLSFCNISRIQMNVIICTSASRPRGALPVFSPLTTNHHPSLADLNVHASRVNFYSFQRDRFHHFPLINRRSNHWRFLHSNTYS